MNLSNETTLYLVVYIATLAGHLFLAGTVLVGALVAGVLSWRSARSEALTQTSEALKSWLPFLFGLAITVGVAPLLFVQVLYQESFYSANLLLVTRFFALVPALMLGFYLLYLGKGSYLRVGPRATSLALFMAAACFVFIAATWSENHLLSLAPQSWPRVYLEGQAPVHGAAVARLVVFLGLATLSTSVLLRFLLVAHVRLYALMALVGGLIFVAGVVLWHGSMGSVGALSSTKYRYASALVFAALQAVWLLSYRSPSRRLWGLLGALFTGLLIVCVLIVREHQRLAGVDLVAMGARHADAFMHAGSWLFALFFVSNTALIAWCVRLVRRSRPM